VYKKSSNFSLSGA